MPSPAFWGRAYCVTVPCHELVRDVWRQPWSAAAIFLAVAALTRAGFLRSDHCCAAASAPSELRRRDRVVLCAGCLAGLFAFGQLTSDPSRIAACEQHAPIVMLAVVGGHVLAAVLPQLRMAHGSRVASCDAALATAALLWPSATLWRFAVSTFASSDCLPSIKPHPTGPCSRLDLHSVGRYCCPSRCGVCGTASLCVGREQWTLPTCSLAPLSSARIASLLAGKWILFMGDSTTMELHNSLVAFLMLNLSAESPRHYGSQLSPLLKSLADPRFHQACDRTWKCVRASNMASMIPSLAAHVSLSIVFALTGYWCARSSAEQLHVSRPPCWKCVQREPPAWHLADALLRWPRVVVSR